MASKSYTMVYYFEIQSKETTEIRAIPKELKESSNLNITSASIDDNISLKLIIKSSEVNPQSFKHQFSFCDKPITFNSHENIIKAWKYIGETPLMTLRRVANDFNMN